LRVKRWTKTRERAPAGPKAGRAGARGSRARLLGEEELSANEVEIGRDQKLAGERPQACADKDEGAHGRGPWATRSAETVFRRAECHAGRRAALTGEAPGRRGHPSAAAWAASRGAAW
jgi:hypothetical protein